MPRELIEQPYISNIECSIILSKSKGKSSTFEAFESIERGEQLTSIDGPGASLRCSNIRILRKPASLAMKKTVFRGCGTPGASGV
ncbi:MAG: hypothetical protein EB127_03010 [Alphaproteobacteria bacterium]|nr:hypothetical protein [Alphaproteobacteria bacterium]